MAKHVTNLCSSLYPEGASPRCCIVSPPWRLVMVTLSGSGLSWRAESWGCTRHPGGSQQHATTHQPAARERGQTSNTTVRMQLLRVQHCMGSPIIDIVIQALLQVRVRVGRIRLPPPAQCSAAQHSALIRASQV